MKYIYAIALFLVALMVGCADDTTEPTTPTEPETPPADTQPDTPPVTPPTGDDTMPEDTTDDTGDGEDTTDDMSGEDDMADEDKKEMPEGDIKITAEGFEPAELTIKVGESVTFVNAQEDKSASLGAPILSGPIEPMTAFTYTFDEAGKVKLFNIIGAKTGYVTVEEEAPPAETDDAQGEGQPEETA